MYRKLCMNNSINKLKGIGFTANIAKLKNTSKATLPASFMNRVLYRQ